MIGLLRGHEHRATRRVLAHERALRAAQNLDARDVVVRLGREVAGKGCHAVAIGDHTRRRLRVVLRLADAADVEVDALAEVVYRGAGRDELELIDRGDTAVRDVFTGQHRYGNRRGLQVGATSLGGDDDLSEISLLLWPSRWPPSRGGVCATAGQTHANCTTAQAVARSTFSMPLTPSLHRS